MPDNAGVQRRWLMPHTQIQTQDLTDGKLKRVAREEREVGGFKCQMSYVVETSSSEKTGCRWRGVMK